MRLTIQTTESLPHGITRNSLIDAPSRRIVQIVSTRGSQTLQSLSYEWDVNGNLTKRTDHTKSAPNNAEVFTYDNLDRLVSSKVGNQSTVTHDYDAKGNLTNTTGGSSSATRSYPEDSYKVSNATIKGVNRSYTYDAAGFVTSMDVENVTAGDTTFQWTSFGQLREIQKISAPPLMTLPQSSFSDPAFAGIPEWTRFQNSTARAVFGFDAGGNRARQFLERTFANGDRAMVTTRYLGSYEQEIHATDTLAGGGYGVSRTLHRHRLGGVVLTHEQVGKRKRPAWR